jgi:hypothetical protein
MGHQVNFLALPTDLPTMEAAIRATGDVCFLEDRTPTAKPAELDTPLLCARRDGAASPGRVCRPACRSERSHDDVRPRSGLLGDRVRFLAGHRVQPVFLRRHRAATRPGAYFATDLRFRPELPSPDFVIWGDRVLGRIKKTLRRAPGIPNWIYVSSDALRWIEEHHAARDNLGAYRSSREHQAPGHTGLKHIVPLTVVGGGPLRSLTERWSAR